MKTIAYLLPPALVLLILGLAMPRQEDQGIPTVPDIGLLSCGVVGLGSIPALPPKGDGCSAADYAELVAGYNSANSVLKNNLCAILPAINNTYETCLANAQSVFASCLPGCREDYDAATESCFNVKQTQLAAIQNLWKNGISANYRFFANEVRECNN